MCSQAPLGCAGCNNKGHCVTNSFGQEVCECFPWHSGQRCQVNLKGEIRFVREASSVTGSRLEIRESHEEAPKQSNVLLSFDSLADSSGDNRSDPAGSLGGVRGNGVFPSAGTENRRQTGDDHRDRRR